MHTNTLIVYCRSFTLYWNSLRLQKKFVVMFSNAHIQQITIYSCLSLNFNRNLTFHFELSLYYTLHPHLPFLCRSWHQETIERLRTLLNETIHLFHLTYKSSRSSLAISKLSWFELSSQNVDSMHTENLKW